MKKKEKKVLMVFSNIYGRIQRLNARKYHISTAITVKRLQLKKTNVYLSNEWQKTHELQNIICKKIHISIN